MLSSCLGLGRNVCVWKGGEKKMVVSGWLVPLESYPHPSSCQILHGRRSGGWGESSDTAKHNPERRQISSCDAAHSSSLIELCWRKGEGGRGGAGSMIQRCFCSSLPTHLNPVSLSRDSGFGVCQRKIGKITEEPMVNRRSFITRVAKFWEP